MTRFRVPPQAIEVEKHVIGALLLSDPDAQIAFERLTPEDFYLEKHQVIWEGLRTLVLAGQQADFITLEHALIKAGTLQKAGGAAYLMEIGAEVVSSANIVQHAEIIKEKSQMRRLILGCGKLMDAAYDAESEPASLLGEAESLILSLAEERVAQGLVPFRSIIPETMADLARAASGKLTGVTTGLADLDRITSGFQPTDLILIAGRPAMGKTALGLTIAVNAALADEPVAFFSMEMGKKQLQQRAFCAHRNLDLHKLRQGKLTAEEMEMFKASVEALQNIPLYIDDQNAKTPLQILSQSKRMKMQKGLKLIVVDFCQLGRLDKAVDNRALEVGQFAYGLKGIAKELEIPVVGLAQLNREVEKRSGDEDGDIEYKQSDLNESGGLEQAADIIGMVHRFEVLKKTAEKGKAKMQLVKYRNGPTGDINLRFNAESASFSDYITPSWMEGAEHAGHHRAPSRTRNEPPRNYPGDPGPRYEPHRPARMGEAGWDL